MILEVPCGNIESVEAAVSGGADRIELCSAMPLGGLTPTTGMLEAIAHHKIKKFVMIRPREGDFLFSAAEFRSMLRDIAILKNAGAHGIVSGILTKDGEIDKKRCKELIQAARPLTFTFHRAFDLTIDPIRSLEALIELKVDYLLTSGQAADALTGSEMISKLVHQSGNRIKIIAGAGINSANVATIIELTGVKEIHLSGRVKRISEMKRLHSSVSMGNASADENQIEVTDVTIINEVRKIIDSRRSS